MTILVLLISEIFAAVLTRRSQRNKSDPMNEKRRASARKVAVQAEGVRLKVKRARICGALWPKYRTKCSASHLGNNSAESLSKQDAVRVKKNSLRIRTCVHSGRRARALNTSRWTWLRGAAPLTTTHRTLTGLVTGFSL